MKRVSFLLAACLAFLTALPAIAAVLHRGNDADPETLDPHKTSTVAEANLLRDLYEGLVIHDMKAEVAPGVAESWTVSPDGLTYAFKLRATARWSNGDAVTADDFVFSLRRLLDPATGSKYAPVMYPILNAEKVHKAEAGARPESLGVTAVAADRLEIRLERPTGYFLELLTNMTALPVHRPSLARHGADWVKPGNKVSNGAYVLKSFVPNSTIAMTRNPRHHDAANVAIEEVRFYPTPDSAVAVRRFEAGELHMVSDLPADQLARLKTRFGTQVYVSPYLGTSFLVVNTARKPFDDARVRRALALAIDREFLAEQIWSGSMQPAYGVVPPGIQSYPRRALADFEADTPDEREDKARKLLAEAGFGPGRPPLRVELRYNTSDNNQRTMVAIASQWKAIGVTTTLVQTETRAHFAHLRDGGAFDVARYGWIADYADAQNFLFLLESGNTGLNVGRFANADFDRLMRAAAAEANVSRRADLLHQADTILARELPWLPVLYYQSKMLVSPRVEGFTPNVQAAYATRFLRLKN